MRSWRGCWGTRWRRDAGGGRSREVRRAGGGAGDCGVSINSFVAVQRGCPFQGSVCAPWFNLKRERAKPRAGNDFTPRNRRNTVTLTMFARAAVAAIVLACANAAQHLKYSTTQKASALPPLGTVVSVIPSSDGTCGLLHTHSTFACAGAVGCTGYACLRVRSNRSLEGRWVSSTKGGVVRAEPAPGGQNPRRDLL